MLDLQEIPESTLESVLQDFLKVVPHKVERLLKKWQDSETAPVHTWQGTYRSCPWTDWTRGFLYGSSLLYSEICADLHYSATVRDAIRKYMPPHLTHTGVHDHGFNNISTYGNALRLQKKRLHYDENPETLKLALRVSGAVQAMRFTRLPDRLGYIYSFHGAHSLFADTIRSLRSLALAHQLGQVLHGENEERINLLERLLAHAETTARYIVFHGEERDIYDVPGRTAHEAIFNTANGQFRSPSTQQGFSGYSTWTRGLAWIMLGYTEIAEYIADCIEETEIKALQLPYFPDKETVLQRLVSVARLTADFYIHNTTPCGVPFWDTAAPGLPINHSTRDWEPAQAPESLDSSAAAIAAQAFARLASLSSIPEKQRSNYGLAARRIAKTLFSDPYLSRDPEHEGLILHSVYHIPNGWDYTPPGASAPCGEATMWGDYHAIELALSLVETQRGSYYHFYDI